MIRVDIKRTPLFNELQDDFKALFDAKGCAVMDGVDTIYYSVHLMGDDNENLKVKNLIDDLEELKKKVVESREPQLIPNIPDLQLTLKSFVFYRYCITMPEMFDIFVADYIPNTSTCRIVVQLRSASIWQDGYRKAIFKSYSLLFDLLKPYGLKIAAVKENRIDFNFHTNMLQSGFKFLNDTYLNNHLSTTLKIHCRIGDVLDKRNDQNQLLTIDYLSLGNRKSNNLFVRIYDKTKEVVALGYKAFFFEIWHRQGLISSYDKFVLEYAYKSRDYNKIYEGMLSWYIQFGLDESRKKMYSDLIKDKDTRLSDLKVAAEAFMPAITTIFNIEYETKRRLYHELDNAIGILFKKIHGEINPWEKPLARLITILDNRAPILEYLTTTTMSFNRCKGEGDAVAWWARIQNHKVTVDSTKIKEWDFLRTYSKNIDKEIVLKRLTNTLATLNTYDRRVDTTFEDDLSYYLDTINDNTKAIKFMDHFTGEIMTDFGLPKDVVLKYDAYKDKKYRAIKNKLPNPFQEL